MKSTQILLLRLLELQLINGYLLSEFSPNLLQLWLQHSYLLSFGDRKGILRTLCSHFPFMHHRTFLLWCMVWRTVMRSNRSHRVVCVLQRTYLLKFEVFSRQFFNDLFYLILLLLLRGRWITWRYPQDITFKPHSLQVLTFRTVVEELTVEFPNFSVVKVLILCQLLSEFSYLRLQLFALITQLDHLLCIVLLLQDCWLPFVSVATKLPL